MHLVLSLIMLLPLIGAVLLILFGRILPRKAAELTACTSLIGAFILSLAAFVAGPQGQLYTLYDWIRLEDFAATISIRYDGLAAVMALMITFVSSLIMVYSVSFMRRDTDYLRFFCYLDLFVFFMLVIVLADNLVFLFLGWEGVGFCSYALIGFWYEDPANATAGRKAFLLTRIGDVGFGIAMALLFVTCHTLTIAAVNAAAPTLPAATVLLVGLLFLWAATGKSAQLPLLVWLPDAMAGPTPVSALIHAATMVTAGVYLLIRMFPLISLVPGVLQLIALVGTVTALYAACAALAQRDIKRVLAYSTISQVGYMFLGVGAGDIIGSTFHLLTHAFFKSLLFLAAGCVIHALHGEHDILRMGRSLRRQLPAVFLLFLAGGLALGGVPPSAGFVSKGRILLAALNHQSLFWSVIWACGSLTALLTTLYTFRLVFLVFTGAAEDNDPVDPREITSTMNFVLWPLAFAALFGGALNASFLSSGSGWLTHWLAHVPGAVTDLGAAVSLEWTVEITDAVLAIAGVAVAYFLYGPPDVLCLRSENPFGERSTAVILSGFGLDRLYGLVVVRPYTKIAGYLWRDVDEVIIDGSLLRTALIFPVFASGLRRWSTGYLSASLKMLLVGFAAILVLLVIG